MQPQCPNRTSQHRGMRTWPESLWQLRRRCKPNYCNFWTSRNFGPNLLHAARALLGTTRQNFCRDCEKNEKSRKLRAGSQQCQVCVCVCVCVGIEWDSRWFRGLNSSAFLKADSIMILRRVFIRLGTKTNGFVVIYDMTWIVKPFPFYFTNSFWYTLYTWPYISMCLIISW